MNRLKILAVAAAAAACFAAAAPAAHAQVSVNIGAAPLCPYGYYGYAPYGCAPYGYYGPEWFVGGVFIGAGPWFHGPLHFRGHVDSRFDPRHGYRGPMPHPREVPEPSARFDQIEGFRGSEMHGALGHEGGERR